MTKISQRDRTPTRMANAAGLQPVLSATALVALAVLGGGFCRAADQPQWGSRYSRNMASTETGLPASFDPKTGKHVKWSVELGTRCYSTPVIAGGRVLIGTNNEVPRDPRHEGDRGVLMCLDEADGHLCWQFVVPKLEGDIYLDWPQAGICSPPSAEASRVYLVTNRAEVACLDLAGQADGNDGPYLTEGQYMALRDRPTMDVTATDADILWLLDMRSVVGIHPHDSAHGSILIDGSHLYVNTGNGVDNTHRRIRAPQASCLIAIDKQTGRLVARDQEEIGLRIFHAAWSSPALGRVGSGRRVFFGGPDGICYGFAALPDGGDLNAVKRLERVWRFDCDPNSPKEDVHRYIGNRREGPSDIKGMPVFYRNRLYVTVGGDIWWGKREARLQCIDATGTGDTTTAGPIWSYPLQRHCCCTPAIADGLVYVTDCGGNLHCVDAETGHPCWVHDAGGEIWGSPLVADGKVYVGTRRGRFWTLAAGRQKQVIASVRLDDPIVGSPVAANGVLYVATMTRLFALEETPRGGTREP